MSTPSSAPAVILRSLALVLFVAGAFPGALVARQDVDADVAVQAPDSLQLTLEGMVQMALKSSYQIKYLNLGLDQSRLRLKASQARLRSRVDLDFNVPTINSVSETRWDPTLQRNVIQRENSRRVDAELSVRQPVILFGYPTNGYLSLNNRLYRLTQYQEEDSDLRYYNRYFVSYTQPLFQANELRNDLEEAELGLESQELDFIDDVVGIIGDSADDWYDLFQIAGERRIAREQTARLEAALAAAEALAGADSARQLDLDQVRVELGNARENLTATQTQFRLEAAQIAAAFGLPAETTLTLDPVTQLSRVVVDEERALKLAQELAPRIRQLDINLREAEIDLDNREGRGGFEVDVRLSYGREMQDEVLGNIWSQPENSYTVDVEGSVPIWDWGERSARIQVERIEVEEARLRIEEAVRNINADVVNQIRSVQEFEQRAFNLQENLALARQISERSLARFADGTGGALDLLQNLRREADTAENFLRAYLGWRRALQRLQEITYYDWEYDAPVLDRFGIEPTAPPATD
jgi:outer membrane protein TolC